MYEFEELKVRFPKLSLYNLNLLTRFLQDDLILRRTIDDEYGLRFYIFFPSPEDNSRPAKSFINFIVQPSFDNKQHAIFTVLNPDDSTETFLPYTFKYTSVGDKNPMGLIFSLLENFSNVSVSNPSNVSDITTITANTQSFINSLTLDHPKHRRANPPTEPSCDFNNNWFLTNIDPKGKLWLNVQINAPDAKGRIHMTEYPTSEGQITMFPNKDVALAYLKYTGLASSSLRDLQLVFRNKSTIKALEGDYMLPLLEDVPISSKDHEIPQGNIQDWVSSQYGIGINQSSLPTEKKLTTLKGQFIAQDTKNLTTTFRLEPFGSKGPLLDIIHSESGYMPFTLKYTIGDFFSISFSPGQFLDNKTTIDYEKLHFIIYTYPSPDELKLRMGPMPTEAMAKFDFLLKNSEAKLKFLPHDWNCDPQRSKTLHHALVTGARNCGFPKVNDFADYLFSGKAEAERKITMNFNYNSYPDAHQCIEAWHLGAYQNMNSNTAVKEKVPPFSIIEAQVDEIIDDSNIKLLIKQKSDEDGSNQLANCQIPSKNIGQFKDILQTGDALKIITSNEKWLDLDENQDWEPFTLLDEDMPVIKISKKDENKHIFIQNMSNKESKGMKNSPS